MLCVGGGKGGAVKSEADLSVYSVQILLKVTHTQSWEEAEGDG